MRSRITNRLILFGACEDHEDELDRMNTRAQINQVQAVETEETKISSIMKNLAISDFEPVDSTMDTQ